MVCNGVGSNRKASVVTVAAYRRYKDSYISESYNHSNKEKYIMITRHRSTDVPAAINKMKVAAMKVLRNTLKNGTKEQQLLAAEKILILSNAFEAETVLAAAGRI